VFANGVYTEKNNHRGENMTKKPSKKHELEINKERAFTLIELLVVIAIMGILVGLISVGALSARTKGYEIETINQMRSLAHHTLQFIPENRFYYPAVTHPTWDHQILNFMQGKDPLDPSPPEYDPKVLLSSLDRVRRVTTPPDARSYSYSSALANWFGWDSRSPRYHGPRASFVVAPESVIMYLPIFEKLNEFCSHHHASGMTPVMPGRKTFFLAFCDGSVRAFTFEEFNHDPMGFWKKYLFIDTERREW